MPHFELQFSSVGYKWSCSCVVDEMRATNKAKSIGMSGAYLNSLAIIHAELSIEWTIFSWSWWCYVCTIQRYIIYTQSLFFHPFPPFSQCSSLQPHFCKLISVNESQTTKRKWIHSEKDSTRFFSHHICACGVCVCFRRCAEKNWKLNQIFTNHLINWERKREREIEMY